MKNRRSVATAAFLAAALATVVLGALAPAVSWAQQVTLRVHHFLPGNSNTQVNVIQPWCDKVARESNNRLKCQIYPAMQLGGTPAQLFDQVRDGTVDIVWTLPTYAAGRFVKSEVFELPFVTKTAAGSSKAMWTYVQKNALDEFKGTHLLFTHVHDGTALFFRDKNPTALAGLRGVKIRAATRIGSQMLAALGAAPVQMPLPQVPESMSKGVIDGASVPWEGVPAIKLQEIAKFALDTPPGKPRMSNSIFIFTMNQARYDALAPELRHVIDANSGLETSGWAGSRYDATVEPHKKLLRDHGGKITTISDAEFDHWVKATDGVDDAWIKTVDARGADGKKLLGEAKALVQRYDR